MGYQLLDTAHAVAIVRQDADADGSGLRLRLASLFWVAALGAAYVAGAVVRSLSVALAVLGLALVVTIVMVAGPRRLAAIARWKT